MYGIVMFMIGALVTGAAGPVRESGLSYTVASVETVLDATAFGCRIRDYVQPTAMRFSVRLRDVDVATDPNTSAAARRFLSDRLSNARQIKLYNVQDRGYFRLTADVHVDGADVGAQMLEYGLIRQILPVEPMLQPQTRAEPLFFESPAKAIVKPRAAPAVTSGASLHQLLGRTVDLSRIGPETTVQEALTMVADAVEPRLPLLILWNDLERNAFVERDMPIGIEGFGRIRLDRALDLILRAAQAAAGSDTALTLTPEGGILTLATRHAGLDKPRSAVYSVGDIFAAPSEQRSVHGGRNDGRGGGHYGGATMR